MDAEEDAGDAPLKPQKPLTAQDILDKSTDELIPESPAEEASNRKEEKSDLKTLRIITAILLGQKRNKDLSKVLDTDKSYTSKQINELEKQGIIEKEGEGRNITYVVNPFNALDFLQKKVVIKWKKEDEDERNK